MNSVSSHFSSRAYSASSRSQQQPVGADRSQQGADSLSLDDNLVQGSLRGAALLGIPAVATVINPLLGAAATVAMGLTVGEHCKEAAGGRAGVMAAMGTLVGTSLAAAGSGMTVMAGLPGVVLAAGLGAAAVYFSAVKSEN